MHQYSLLPFSVLAWFLLCLFGMSIGWGQNERISLQYPVSKISFRYGQVHPSLPDLELLKKAVISLGNEEDISLTDLMRGASGVLYLDDRDLYDLADISILLLKDSGFEGVLALPNPAMIDPVSGQDRRETGDSSLEILVWCSVLDEVVVEGKGLLPIERERLEKRISSFVEEEKVLGEPVRSGLVEYISDMSEHPSRNSRVVLSAGSQPGKVRAVVQARRSKKPNFSISTSNSGSEATGKWLFNFSAQTDQLSGRDDQVGVGYTISNTGERHSLIGSYYIPLVRPEFTTLGIGVGYSSYDASTFALTDIDFDGDNLFLDLSLRGKPSLYLGDNLTPEMEFGLRMENVSAFNSLFGNSADATMVTPRVTLSLESKGTYRMGNSRASLFGNMSSIDEDDREALGGYDATDRYARLQISHQETFFLGKWIEDTFNKAPSEYFSHQLLSIRAQFDFGLSGKRHLPHHQFIAGGTGSVRGYPESPVAGDSGQLLSVEYQIPFYYYTDSYGQADLPWTLGAFIDWARVGVNDPLFFESDQNLLGIGVGVQILLPRGLYARFDLAKPMRELKVGSSVIDGTESSDYRVHGNLGWNF
jgi:hemolysin activation/secretion protein